MSEMDATGTTFEAGNSSMKTIETPYGSVMATCVNKNALRFVEIATWMCRRFPPEVMQVLRDQGQDVASLVDELIEMQGEEKSDQA